MTITTTHDPLGGGHPQLLFTGTAPTDRSRAHPLHRGRNTLGSDPANDLCLPGLAPFHAEITRDARDDYVLVSLSSQTRVHGRAVGRVELHTGARIEIGSWVLASPGGSSLTTAAPTAAGRAGSCPRDRGSAPE